MATLLRLLVTLLLAAGVPALAAADVAEPASVLPLRPVLPAPGWGVYAGSCLAPGFCAGWTWLDRRPPRRPVAPEQPVFQDADLWGGAGSPWGYVRRLPPPTPQSQIQPRYRDASTIRPEFQTQ